MLVYQTKPHPHQEEAVQKSWDKPAFALFMEMGTGKTKVTIDSFANLFLAGKIEGVIVVAPKGVYMNWYDPEIPVHLLKTIPTKMAYWTSSPNEVEKKRLEDVMIKEPGKLNILIVNVEAYSLDKAYQLSIQFMKKFRTFMVVDESTSIKNPEASRTKKLLKIRVLAAYRRVLTGTPVTQSPLDLYAQLNFLDPKILGFPNYFSFRARYAKLEQSHISGKNFKTVVGYQNLDELSEKVKRYCYEAKKDQCLSLPQKIYQRRMVDMSPEQKKHYESFRKYAMTVLADTEIAAPSVLAILQKLHQISCGFIIDENGVSHEVGSTKLAELEAIIDESPADQKIIIWAAYRHSIFMLENFLKKKYGENSVVTYFGDTTQKQRGEAIASFKEHGVGARFFLANARTGGYGLTLVSSTLSIYYANTYSLEQRLQSEDRNHRIGQNKPVTYIDLVTKNTVDEKILNALRNKIDIASQVMREDPKKWVV